MGISKKILVITSCIDYTVDYIIDKYKDIATFYRVNIDKFEEYEFILRDNYTWQINSLNWKVNLNEINSIYYRKPVLPNLDVYNPAYHNMIAKDIISLINGIVDSFDRIVLTKPFILRKVENKIYQTKLANECGLIMPNSLVTNEFVMANRFISNNKTIIKPISTGKIVDKGKIRLFNTSIISKNVSDINLTPIYLQEYIDKLFEVRVTIINQHIYPVKIIPYNEVDWRIEQEKNIYELIDIPNQVKYKCINLMNKMNINFGAFDFIVNKRGEYIFLEVNPNGQWLWLEEELNINISNKIVSYLLEEKYNND